MQAFECLGYWFLPETPANRVPGTLRVSASGKVDLALIGALGTGGPLGSKAFPCILGVGESRYGDEITLTGCHLSEGRSGPEGMAIETYRANSAFLGAHLQDSEDFRFRHMELLVGGFKWWVRPKYELQEARSE